MIKKIIIWSFISSCLGSSLIALLVFLVFSHQLHPVQNHLPDKAGMSQMASRTSIAVVDHMEILRAYNQILTEESELSDEEKRARLLHLSEIMGRIEALIARQDHVTFLVSDVVDTSATDLTALVYDEALKYQNEALKKGWLSTREGYSYKGDYRKAGEKSEEQKRAEKEEKITIGDDLQKKLDFLLNGMSDS
jgi:hypothetical protein